MTNLDSKPKFEKLTAVKAAYWLSEAWGETIKPNDVRLRGNWMFVRYSNDEDVDCIFVPTGNDLHGEPWSDISHNESPFVIKDKAKIEELTAKLDAEYKAHLIDGCHWTEADWVHMCGGKYFEIRNEDDQWIMWVDQYGDWALPWSDTMDRELKLSDLPAHEPWCDTALLNAVNAQLSKWVKA